MKLEELKQIKDSLDKGVIVSKKTWLRVLDAAIEGKQPKEIHSERFHNLAMDYRAAPPAKAHEPYEDLCNYIMQWRVSK